MQLLQEMVDQCELNKLFQALMIDMRDINFCSISETKASARIGGGILIGKVAADLSREGLTTPVGAVPFVGYVGWVSVVLLRYISDNFCTSLEMETEVGMKTNTLMYRQSTVATDSILPIMDLV